MTTLGGSRTTVLDRRVPIDQDRDVLTASMGLPLGTSDVLIPSPLLMVRNEALLAKAGLDVGDKGAVKWARYLLNRDIARRMAVRFIASVHPMESEGFIPRVRGDYSVVEDTLALPRVRVVGCVEHAVNGDDAFAKILKLDPEQFVVVEGDLPSACVDGSGTALFTEYTDQAVTIAATGPGALVVADTWYPGWVTTLDGAEVPILRADLIYRAVQLPAGDHVVEMRYQPTRIWLLMVVSGLSTLVAVLGAIRSKRIATS
mgnify:CR=1 FL=1